MNIKNTFWTIIEDSYYRIQNGVLKYAPINTDKSVLTSEESEVNVISTDILELINYEFGSSFVMTDF